MTWYLRDWKMLQSYKRKRPSWIKLPLELLYDPCWRRITDRQARALVTIWMIAAECGTEGNCRSSINSVPSSAQHTCYSLTLTSEFNSSIKSTRIPHNLIARGESSALVRKRVQS